MDTAPVLLCVLVLLLGLAAGSFLNVCICRIPGGERVTATPSHCMRCGKGLRWFECIPLFSFLVLKGRCSGCKSRISAQYPLVEAVNGVLWCIVFLRFGCSPICALGCLLVSALLVLAVIDARTREIPPGVSLFVLILGALRLLLCLNSWSLYLIGFFAVSVPLYLILVLTGGRGIGGGDVKLMAGAGLFLGWKDILLAFFLACLLGSVIHLTLMALKKAGRTLALGPYLAAGIFVALIWGEALIHWYLGLFAL